MRPCSISSGADIVNSTGKYHIEQKGYGKYSLCKECNNNTGTWYAKIYVEVSKFVAFSLKDTKLEHGDIIVLKFNEFPVLPMVKQIVSMFCSIIPYEYVEKFGFKEFLLNKDSNVVRYDLFELQMYLTSMEYRTIYSDKMIYRECGKEDVVVADLAVFPFGFILNYDSKNNFPYGRSINTLFGCTYNGLYSFELPLMYIERGFGNALTFKPIPSDEELDGEYRVLNIPPTSN